MVEVIMSLRNPADPGDPECAGFYTYDDRLALKEESSTKKSSGAQTKSSLYVQGFGRVPGAPGAYRQYVPTSEKILLNNAYRSRNALNSLAALDGEAQILRHGWQTFLGQRFSSLVRLPPSESCVPSEEEEFNRGVRNPAGGDLEHSRPLE